MKKFKVEDIRANDSLAACIASILEKNIEMQRAFKLDAPYKWVAQTKALFLQFGYNAAVINPDSGFLPKPISIAVGDTKNGKRKAVILRGGDIFHDPDPSTGSMDTIHLCFVPIKLTESGEDFNMSSPPDQGLPG